MASFPACKFTTEGWFTRALLYHTPRLIWCPIPSGNAVLDKKGKGKKTERSSQNAQAAKKQSCSSAFPPRSCKEFLAENWQKALEAALHQPLEQWQNALLEMSESQRERVRKSPGTFRFPGKKRVGKHFWKVRGLTADRSRFLSFV